jgi:hypothetical protein
MEQIIKDNRDYVKVNGSYIINRNDKEYRAALLRARSANRLNNIEKRVENLESKLDLILELLKEKK